MFGAGAPEMVEMTFQVESMPTRPRRIVHPFEKIMSRELLCREWIAMKTAIPRPARGMANRVSLGSFAGGGGVAAGTGVGDATTSAFPPAIGVASAVRSAAEGIVVGATAPGAKVGTRVGRVIPPTAIGVGVAFPAATVRSAAEGMVVGATAPGAKVGTRVGNDGAPPVAGAAGAAGAAPLGARGGGADAISAIVRARPFARSSALNFTAPTPGTVPLTHG